MAGLAARLASPGWLRAPRPTARLRLTLLYGGLFLLSGAVLLAVTYVLVEKATDAITLHGDKIVFSSPPAMIPVKVGTTGGRRSSVFTRQPVSAQATRLLEQAAQLHAFDLHELLIRSAIALALVAVLSVALGWLVAGRVLRPVRTISAAARQIGASNLHERLRLDGPDDEFGELATTLDGLLERLEASFNSQRHFVANASHELRTPLTLDRALLERALRTPKPTHAFWRTTCERLLVSSQQQDRLIEALLTLARSETGVGRREPFELSSVIDNVLLSPELDAGHAGLQIETKIGPAPVSGDPRLVERLVRNLVDNAIRYNEPSGRVDIAAATRSGRAVLTVANTGPAIPPADIDRLFQPFQRLARSRGGHAGGTGLGLSIVKAIADAHQASVTAICKPQGGLSIEVAFPPARQSDRRHADADHGGLAAADVVEGSPQGHRQQVGGGHGARVRAAGRGGHTGQVGRGLEARGKATASDPSLGVDGQHGQGRRLPALVVEDDGQRRGVVTAGHPLRGGGHAEQV
jgi:signal transduction histidine kinase